MKNNILLILAVTVISIGIIVATVMISGGNDQRSSSDSSSSGTSSTTTADTITQPTEETPLAPAPETTTAPVETAPPVEATQEAYDSDAAERIISTAHSLIGIDFAEGGDTPEAGFDNSGFIYYVLRENGYITCPRGLKSQSEMGAALSYDQLRAGDLAFFHGEGTQSISFGGIYCGDGIMLACLMPGTQVKEINIASDYYKEHFANGVGIT